MTSPQNLLSCWHKLEHFTPAALPTTKDVKELTDILPWEIPVKAKSTNKTIVYTIYLGVFKLTKALDFINVFFNDKSEKPNSLSSSNIYFATIKLDNEGLYIENSLGISTFTWALGQLESGQLESNNWSRNFQFMYQSVIDTLTENQNEIEEDYLSYLSEPQTYDNLYAIQSIIARVLGWSEQPLAEIYVKTDEVYKSSKDKENQPTELLNSFFISDLERLIHAFDNGETNNAIQTYVNGCLNRTFPHKDLSKHIEILKGALHPDNYPDGCWPSKYKASLMQQFAVNMVWKELTDRNKEGIFSVNGPPGTGKTTLLRDVIAAILVKRAKFLAEYKEPADAFHKIGQVDIKEGFTPFIYNPDKRICDFGVVVASSNNGAVENISKELPLKKEVEPYAAQIGYFRSTAENCMDENYWGVIAATLGNRKNCTALSDSIWFNKETEHTLAKYLKNQPATGEDWNNAVKEFNKNLKAVTKEKKRLSQIVDAYEEYPKTLQQVTELASSYSDIQGYLDSLQKKGEELESQRLTYEQCIANALSKLQTLQQTRPGLFTRLFSAKIRNAYNQALNQTLNAYNQAENDLQTHIQIVAHHKLQLDNAHKKSTKIVNDYKKSKIALAALEALLSAAKNELGNTFADSTFWEQIESKESQTACPWYSHELKQLQSQLFVSAMRVNETFILRANATSNRIKTTLDGFFHYMKEGATLTPEEINAIWQTFLLVIPVVSTTFASVSRMFSDMERGVIPWLFIDEAGQAVPQAATGAIWRAQRVVAVGDPFQIEPVVTIPETITNHIGKYFDIDKSQLNSSFSVQSMADRTNKYGWVSNETWIGSPLRVHRRCVDPMFTIANKIAYEGMMYNATTPQEPSIRLTTQFIHVEGRVSGKHYVPEQGKLVLDLLLDEIAETHKLPDIFVISPFTEIPYKLIKAVLFKPLQQALRLHDEAGFAELQEWLRTHVGTVHTFQGKQASGVILCLGLDESAKAAAAWASSKPNLLNVAITRAKHRFVAIGDKNIWLSQPYFDQLKSLSRSNTTL